MVSCYISTMKAPQTPPPAFSFCFSYPKRFLQSRSSFANHSLRRLQSTCTCISVHVHVSQGFGWWCACLEISQQSPRFTMLVAFVGTSSKAIFEFIIHWAEYSTYFACCIRSYNVSVILFIAHAILGGRSHEWGYNYSIYSDSILKPSRFCSTHLLLV